MNPNDRPALLILAAGLATRYQSLKQMDGFGPSGETLMDYAVYDALRAGFGKVVFVIRKSFEKDFCETIVSRYHHQIDVDYVFQETDDVPEEFRNCVNREKPWGTAQAIWSARSAINQNFCSINADDFYGLAAFRQMAEHLTKTGHDAPPAFSMVAYPLLHTLSAHGSVSRGVCVISPEHCLQQITEQSRIQQEGTRVFCVQPDGSELILAGDSFVSMNCWGFTPQVFEFLQQDFVDFLDQKSTDPTAEFMIPTVVGGLISRGLATVRVMYSHDEWFGVTYPADKPIVSRKIIQLVEAGVYPEKLWV